MQCVLHDTDCNLSMAEFDPQYYRCSNGEFGGAKWTSAITVFTRGGGGGVDSGFEHSASSKENIEEGNPAAIGKINDRFWTS